MAPSGITILTPDSGEDRTPPWEVNLPRAVATTCVSSSRDSKSLEETQKYNWVDLLITNKGRNLTRRQVPKRLVSRENCWFRVTWTESHWRNKANDPKKELLYTNLPRNFNIVRCERKEGGRGWWPVLLISRPNTFDLLCSFGRKKQGRTTNDLNLSDFVTNSYGESWNPLREKSWVSV